MWEGEGGRCWSLCNTGEALNVIREERFQLFSFVAASRESVIRFNATGGERTLVARRRIGLRIVARLSILSELRLLDIVAGDS